jgi:hypothetical protein
MLIELALFPLVMGWCLHVCCLPLFPGATIQGHLAIGAKHPMFSFFAHWLAGTLFMCVSSIIRHWYNADRASSPRVLLLARLSYRFAFARCLALCRSICRKGAMYSIR